MPKSNFVNNLGPAVEWQYAAIVIPIKYPKGQSTDSVRAKVESCLYSTSKLSDVIVIPGTRLKEVIAD